MITGAGIGVTYFVLFCSYCLAFWYGGKLIRDGEFNVGNMLVVSIYHFCKLLEIESIVKLSAIKLVPHFRWCFTR